MKIAVLSFVFAATTSSAALAASPYPMAGNSSLISTSHHCGYLPATQTRYTSSAITTRIVERKLKHLGYAKVQVDGRYGASDTRAVRQFQRKHGLQVDGIVGPKTAQHLAYASHPSAQVRRCTNLSQR